MAPCGLAHFLLLWKDRSKRESESRACAFCRLPLDAMKGKIESNLYDLEKAGVVSHRDNYQALINSIVQVWCFLVPSCSLHCNELDANVKSFATRRLFCSMTDTREEEAVSPSTWGKNRPCQG